MNIGVLFPRSNEYPLIGSAFTEGIKSYLSKEGMIKEVSFLMESIGFGGVEKEVYAKAEKLLMMDDADVLIGFIDEKILELIKPLLLASGKLMIVVNAGANHPLNWVPQSNIIHLTLQHSFLCGVTGSDAAQGEKNKPAAVCSTYYDCGYLHLASMVKEFQASGGAIKFNYINNQMPGDELAIPQLVEFLKSTTEVKTLLSIFDTATAAQFYHQLHQSGATDQHQLFVSPMMLQQKALENLRNSFSFSIYGYMPWHSAVPGAANNEFTGYYREQLKKEPDIFSLLGWETAIVIAEVIRKCAGNYGNGESIAEFLKSITLNGPRGNMVLDEESLYFLFPAIRCSAEAGSTELKMEYNIDLSNEWDEFSEKNTEGAVSGWTNTYLCY
jgi:branched-chain amino acid transport system substrate-binding protein